MLILLIHVINICAQIISEQQFQLYPTEGELYQNQLQRFLPSSQLICKIDHQVSNLQLINQCEEISIIKGDQFISMSSNNTHFCTLSKENIVTIYEWKNQKIQQVGQNVTINLSFNCFNINLSQNFSILIDCYQNNELFLIQIKDEQQKIAYFIQSSIPASTKIQSILNETNAFLVYAQYFEKYSILSLLSSSFQNQSSLNQYQFIDFDVPITISPNIYAITHKEIFQLSISSDSTFSYKYNFNSTSMSNFTIINAFYNFWSYSQCDQIKLLYIEQYSNLYDYKIAQLLGCEGQIIKVIDFCPVNSCQSIQKILQNNQFILYISTNLRVIMQKSEGNSYYFYHLNQSNSLFYFNDDNELFQFNQEILVFLISLPSIQINLTQPRTSYQQLYNFTLICMDQLRPTQLSLVKIDFKILLKNDTNVYVMSNKGFENAVFQYNYSNQISFYGYSGQILNYNLSKNQAYFNLTQKTFDNVGEITQVYQLVQSLVINYYLVVEQYLIGYNNQSIDIQSCQFTQSIQCNLLSSINISVKASSLQVAYSIYPLIVTIGLSSYDKIYLFQYYDDSQSIISYSNYTCEKEISEFVITYNSIIILIQKKQKIKILTFNFTNPQTIEQQSINKFFKKIQFNPIQIVVNSQLQSSLIYINNIDEVIIISIDQNSYPIPISLIQVNFKIKQINLINQQLILSYLCNNDQNMCFQVWNVQNLPKYNYVKNLYSENVDKKVIIQSDNLFLYVTFNNYTVYVYNPSLPYHLSLYYKLELTSPIQFSVQLSLNNQNSIIFSNNNFYILFESQQFNLTYQYSNQDFNNSKSYPQYTYNYTVKSALNNTASQYTPNQTIIFYSNFTVFQNESNQSINLINNTILPNSKNFSYPMNLILDRQVGYCGSTNQNQTYNLNKHCSLTQFSHLSKSIPNTQNYSLITSINNEFFALPGSFQIQAVNSQLQNLSNFFSYSNLNLSECLQSTSYNYTLYSICQNDNAQYLLNFTFNFQGIIVNSSTTSLPQNFQNIAKINTLLYQIFILGSQVNYQQQLYWFNQSDSSLIEISDPNSECQDFSIAQIATTINAINLDQTIIIFYIEQGNKFQLILHKQMLVQSNSITLESSFLAKSYNCENQNCSFPPSHVQILSTFYNRAIIILSDYNNNQMSQIIDFRIKQNQSLLINTIPYYGNFNNTGYSFYKNGVLMQQFSSNEINIVGAYYLNDNLYENLFEPILMQGSFNITTNNYAMIVNQQYKNGSSLYIYNDLIYNYSIGTWNITCLFNRKTQKKINVSIFCKNEFSNGTYNISFNPPILQQSSRRWIYAQISIIGLLLLYFYIKVKNKTRNLEYNKYEIDL